METKVAEEKRTFNKKRAKRYLQDHIDAERELALIYDLDTCEQRMARELQGYAAARRRARRNAIAWAVVAGIFVLGFIIAMCVLAADPILHYTALAPVGGSVGVVTFIFLCVFFGCLHAMLRANKAHADCLMRNNAFMSPERRAQRADERARAVAHLAALKEEMAWIERVCGDEDAFVMLRRREEGRQDVDGSVYYSHKYPMEGYISMYSFLEDGLAVSLPQAVQQFEIERRHQELLNAMRGVQSTLVKTTSAIVASQAVVAAEMRATRRQMVARLSVIDSSVRRLGE